MLIGLVCILHIFPSHTLFWKYPVTRIRKWATLKDALTLLNTFCYYVNINVMAVTLRCFFTLKHWTTFRPHFFSIQRSRIISKQNVLPKWSKASRTLIVCLYLSRKSSADDVLLPNLFSSVADAVASFTRFLSIVSLLLLIFLRVWNPFHKACCSG